MTGTGFGSTTLGFGSTTTPAVVAGRDGVAIEWFTTDWNAAPIARSPD